MLQQALPALAVRAQRLTGLLISPFCPPQSPASAGRSIALARICAGAVLCYQAVSSLGFVSLLGPDAARVGWLNLSIAVASCLLLLGFLTPLAIGWLLYVFAFSPPTGSLANQVTCILLWGLLLLNAGRQLSLDSALARLWPLLAPFLSPLGDAPLSGRPLACVRFGLVALFWGVCLSAMVWHARDDYWLSGQALPMALTGPFYCSCSATFRYWADLSPTGFHYLCVLALAVQSFWEALLLPLLYWRVGRWFVILQGLAFFLSSIFLLNVQYLPLLELCLWLLIFGVPWLPENSPESEAAEQRPQFVNPAVSLFALGSLGAVALLLSLACFSPKIFALAATSRKARCVTGLLGLVGQRPVSVFNQADLELNNYYFVLWEVDAEGKDVRLVPYFDLDGSRLRYVCNDVICYHFAIAWQRAPSSAKFEQSDPARPSEYTQHVARSVAALDARLHNTAPAHRYRVEVYQRTFAPDRAVPRWGVSRQIAGWVLGPVAPGAPTRWPTFELSLWRLSEAPRGTGA